MMELENLRTIWRFTMVSPAGKQSDEELLALLNRRSQGLVAKMKRNLSGELILVLGIYTPAILFYLFSFDGKLAEMGWLFLLLLSIFAGYYYMKNRLLNQMQCPGCRVRSHLERQVTTLAKYVRFYTITGTLLVPFMAVLSFLVASRNLSPASRVTGYPPAGTGGWEKRWIWAMALISVTVVTYYVNSWMMNKLYGRHIKKLRQLLEEMNEE